MKVSEAAAKDLVSEREAVGMGKEEVSQWEGIKGRGCLIRLVCCDLNFEGCWVMLASAVIWHMFLASVVFRLR